MPCRLAWTIHMRCPRLHDDHLWLHGTKPLHTHTHTHRTRTWGTTSDLRGHTTHAQAPYSPTPSPSSPHASRQWCQRSRCVYARRCVSGCVRVDVCLPARAPAGVLGVGARVSVLLCVGACVTQSDDEPSQNACQQQRGLCCASYKICYVAFKVIKPPPQPM